MSDPGALLDQAHRNLRDDGRLFLAVPTLMRPMTPVHPMTLQAIHLWIFSLGTLRLMLAQHGFEIADHSVDAKGLLVTAHKSSARQRADGVRDDPAEVIRYFQAFTDPEGVFATNQTALKQCERRGSCPLVLDVDLTGLHVQTGPDGFLNILDCSCDPHRPLYTEDPRPVSGSWSPEPSLSDEGTVVCMGLGMGYLPEAIRLGLKRDQELLICEADARVYKVAMFHRDLSALLRDERVRLIVRDEAAGFDIVLALIGGSVSAVNQIQVVRCAHSPRWHRAAYDRLAQQIQDWMRVFDILDVAAYHERNGNPGGVIEAYEDGLRLCPGDTRLLQGLAVCCARHGKPDQAELLVRAAVDADPSLAEFAGVLLGGLGLDMAAGDMFRVAVERHHERGDLVRKAAEAYQRAIVRTAEVGVAPTVM